MKREDDGVHEGGDACLWLAACVPACVALPCVRASCESCVSCVNALCVLVLLCCIAIVSHTSLFLFFSILPYSNWCITTVYPYFHVSPPSPHLTSPHLTHIKIIHLFNSCLYQFRATPIIHIEMKKRAGRWHVFDTERESFEDLLPLFVVPLLLLQQQLTTLPSTLYLFFLSLPLSLLPLSPSNSIFIRAKGYDL